MRDLLVCMGILASGAVILFTLDRLGLWMEARGWIYYRRRKHTSGGSLGSAFLPYHSMVEPGKRHVLEQKEQVKREMPDTGDPPEPGKR